MDNKRFYNIFYIIALLIGLFSIAGLSIQAAEVPLVDFSTTTIRPGDFLQVRVREVSQTVVTVKFLERTKELCPAVEGGALIGLVAAPYRTQPGKYPLVLEVKSPQGNQVKEQMIEVVPRKFVEQRIRVSEKMRESTSTDDKVEADAKVGAEVRAKAESRRLSPLWDGAFVRPLAGEKTSDFGLIRYVNDIEHGRHSGWDLAGKTGTPVMAMNKGQVVFAGKLYSSGNTVIIHHGMDLYTSYAHLSKISVKEGVLVTKGQIVGKVGMTGLATGPHLHLTVRVGDVPVDPALLVGNTIDWSKI
ncbi:MAG TPA: M23 family metallopeptidase [Bacillota bacterium]|nr:M23 family metallopeptidase [Bacillota bacterium]